jgi:hypothetical protein
VTANAAPQPILGVFVPGLMGAGILLSAGILVADGVRRLFPNRGARKRVAFAEAVHNIVERTGYAAGVEIPEHRIVRRRPRPRWVYVASSVVLIALSILSIRLGINTYADPDATLHGNPWAPVLGDIAGVLLFLGALLGIVLVVSAHRAPRPVARLIHSTPLGRFAPPPEEPVKRILALHPWLKEGDGS